MLEAPMVLRNHWNELRTLSEGRREQQMQAPSLATGKPSGPERPEGPISTGETRPRLVLDLQDPANLGSDLTDNGAAVL
jgi:hypothetical protein